MMKKTISLAFIATALCGCISAQPPCSLDEMHRAYDNCFGEGEATLARYALADVDDDGRKEVFLTNFDGEEYQGNGHCEAVFTCNADGKLTLIQQTYGMTAGASDYSLCLHKKYKALYYFHSNHGNSEEYVFFLKDSRVVKCLSKETVIKWVGEGEDMKDTYKYYYYEYPITADGQLNYDTRKTVRKQAVEPYLLNGGEVYGDKSVKLEWKKIK